jgi:hypothetical protein
VCGRARLGNPARTDGIEEEPSMTQTAPTTTDWSGRATRTLDTLLERRSEVVDVRSAEHRDREDDALQRFVVAAVAMDEVWTEGAQQVQELEQQAERIRDDVRDRTTVLEIEQARAIMDLLRIRPAEELAVLLDSSIEQVRELVRDAQVTLSVPQPRDSLRE